MFTTPGSRAGRKTANRLRLGHFTGSHSLGVVTGGTVTPDPRVRSFQSYTNGGAHTLVPPPIPAGADCVSMVMTMLNNASAGALTTSAFTQVDGDVPDTTSGRGWHFYITVTPLGSHLNRKRIL